MQVYQNARPYGKMDSYLALIVRRPAPQNTNSLTAIRSSAAPHSSHDHPHPTLPSCVACLRKNLGRLACVVGRFG